MSEIGNHSERLMSPEPPTKKEIRAFERAARRAAPISMRRLTERGRMVRIPLAHTDTGKEGTLTIYTNDSGVVSRRKTTAVEIIDPKRIEMRNGEEIFAGSGVQIQRGGGLPDLIYKTETQYTNDNGTFLNTNPGEITERRGEVSGEELRELTHLLYQVVDVPVRSSLETHLEEATANREFTRRVNSQRDALFAASHRDSERDAAFEDQSAARASHEEKVLAGFRRYGGHGVLHRDVRGRNGSYVTDEGIKVYVHERRDGTWIKEVFPTKEGSHVGEAGMSYTISNDGVYSQATTGISETPDKFEGISLASGEGQASLDAEERERILSVLEGLTDNLTFAKQFQAEGTRLLGLAEVHGSLHEEAGVVSAQFDSQASENKTTRVSARRNPDDGHVVEMSVEQWYPPSPEHSDDIVSKVYYVDPAWPIIAGREMHHRVGVGGTFEKEMGGDRDMGWGKVGLSDPLKVQLYEESATRANFKIEPEERQELLDSLSRI